MIRILIFGKDKQTAIHKLNEIKKDFDPIVTYEAKTNSEMLNINNRIIYKAVEFTNLTCGMRCDSVIIDVSISEYDINYVIKPLTTGSVLPVSMRYYYY